MQDETMALAPTAAGALPAPLPAYGGPQMAQAFAAYRELQAALDQAMPDAIITVGDRQFRRKPYWRAVGVAFNLEVEPIEEIERVRGTFGDGRENFGYLVTYRATAKGGRSVTGDGACFAIEKAESFKCPHPLPGSDWKREHYPHETCPDFDPDFEWHRLPEQATDHNVRSHAHTRAFNRAISNLVGFGEVSAEEVERAPERHGRDDERAPSAPRSYAPPRAAGNLKVSEAQIRRMWVIAKRNEWSEEQVRALYNREGFAHAEEITRGAAYERICNALELPDHGGRS
jgi:hypothetical protein